MTRAIILRKVRNVWRIENANGHVISERRWPSKFLAVEWCNIFLSSFQEQFSVEVVDDNQRQADDKKN